MSPNIDKGTAIDFYEVDEMEDNANNSGTNKYSQRKKITNIRDSDKMNDFKKVNYYNDKDIEQGGYNNSSPTHNNNMSRNLRHQVNNMLDPEK